MNVSCSVAGRGRLATAVVAVAVAAGGLAAGMPAGGAQAAAAQAVTLYVDQSSSSCSDSGLGSQAEPFCTVQAAANVVAAGQTVDIEGGSWWEYREAVVISRSGTPTAPITFTGSRSPGGLSPEIYPSSGVPLSLDGVHDVIISHLALDPVGNTDGAVVAGSQDVTFDNVLVAQEGAPTASPAAITIDGSSSAVTVSRSQLIASAGYGIRTEAGAHQVTITTNYVLGSILVSGTSGADVTSNSVTRGCGAALEIDGGSSAVAENNHLGVTSTSCPAPAAALSVGADSAGTVQADYNALIAASPGTEYSWGGTAYASAAAFAAATGQGRHDIDAATRPARAAPPEGSALIDSADCNAPGELPTDLSGNPRVDDQLVADTGTGTCHADRGAVERQDNLGLSYSTTPSSPQGVVPLDLSVTITSGADSGWGEPLTYTVDFGDGGAPVQVAAGGTATHSYATPGLYTLTVTAADTGGTTGSVQSQVVAGTDAAPKITLGAGPVVAQLPPSPPNIEADTAVFTISAGGDEWELAYGTLSFGDGTSQALGTNLSWYHQYSQPGTYTASLTETDRLGRTSTATATVVAGDEFLPYGPYLDYDSRAASGGTDKVPSHAVVKLPMAALNASGDYVRAAYVNVAVLNPKAAGSVTVYPDGTSRPKQASIQFQAGHAASNKALAMPGSNRIVDFYNGSSAPIDLVVHTFGLDNNAVSSADTYAPDGPVQVLAPTPVPANGHTTVTIAGTHGVPSGADAAVLDITASSTRASGYLTAYPDGAANPGIRDADWAAGQAATSLVVVPLKDGKIVLHNASRGSADFTADLAGYYNLGGTGSVFVPSQRRIMDTATGTGTGGVIAKIRPKQIIRLQISGKNGIPATGISAVAVNLTASGASAAGFIEAYPDGTRPAAKSLSYRPDATTACAEIIPVASDGAIDLYNGGSRGVNLIVDLTGFYYQYPVGP